MAESHTSYFAPGEVVITFEHNISPDEREGLVEHIKAHPILQGEFGYGRLVEAARENPTQDAPSLDELVNSDLIAKLEQTGGLRSALGRLTPEALQTVAMVGEGHYLSCAFLRSDALNDDLMLAYLTSELSYQSQERVVDDREGPIQLLTITPNWFFSGTPASLTDGGPGARPVPPLAVQRGEPVTQDDYLFCPCEFPAVQQELAPANVTLSQIFNTNGEEDTTVFILDAIPFIRQLRVAYNTWGSTNPLLERLFAPPYTRSPHFYQTARLKIHYYDITNDPLFDSYRTKGHNYRMSDHGVFIAGIVDCLAPQTDIRLIEVLNRRGVGTFKSLIWGLADVLNSVRNEGISRFLVNCSLMMALPSNTLLSDAAKNNPIIVFYGVVKPVIDAAVIIQRLFDDIMIQSGGAIVVAAAGNDSELPTTQFAARFPAAYDSVVGVGALTKTGDMARYSNIADNPALAGFLAFGGDSNYKEASSDGGILSVYTAPTYPEGEKNISGWASWAGTSFACAVVSGILARLYAQGMSPADALQLLRDIAMESQTNSAHYIPIGQGQP